MYIMYLGLYKTVKSCTAFQLSIFPILLYYIQSTYFIEYFPIFGMLGLSNAEPASLTNNQSQLGSLVKNGLSS